MSIVEMQAVLEQIKCLDYSFTITLRNDLPFLQGHYVEACVDNPNGSGSVEIQHTRKWFLSEHATKSEIVQTALKCVLTSLEHRAREHFLYQGTRVFGPHFDVDELKRLADAKGEDRRVELRIVDDNHT